MKNESKQVRAMLKNTKSPTLYPITILAIIICSIQLVLSIALVQKGIRFKEFVAVSVLIYICLLVMGFIFQKIDGWLVDYERKRYVEYIHGIDQYDILFEKLLYHQAYETYKNQLLKDDRYKKILLTTVDIARARGEIHEGILKEAIATLDKPEVKRVKPVEITIPSVTPIDMFLKKHRKSDKNRTNDSIKRAADIFLDDKE
jgi:hypothetical protein